ncbi:MAG: hemagglutinin repeat-containing protein, partial [Comamonas sp.]
MNRHLHRVIFSRARGRCMAVPESAASGPGSGDHGPLLATAFALLLAAPLAQAQIIVDPSAPGAERPTVLSAANGTPLVHIQTPSAAGVSRNRYQQFDIGQQGERGAILNNSRGAAQSQLGGAVPGNPWLARGSARVIVNEVRSAAQSRLSGALEVAGQRADVIIANPSGLVVNGLSLINAAGLTLAGGEALYRADGSLDGFRVVRSAIQIEGRGLDASQADYAQVLARAIALNAGIWAQDLRVVTGANHMAADSTLQPRHADAAPPDAPEKPRFALDVAQLGGMYARKILLIGTEAGLGVRNAGVLMADSGPLILSANGQLRNAGVIASQGADADLQLSTRGIDNSARLSSQRDTVLVDGSAETVNAGRIEAGRALLMQAGQLSNQTAGTLTAPRLDIMAARLDNAGHIIQTGPQSLVINSMALSNTGDKALLGAPVPSALAQAAPARPSSRAPGQLSPERGSIHVVQRLANTGLLTANGGTDVKTIHAFTNSATAHLRHLHSEGMLDNRRGVLQMQRLTGAQASVLNQAGSILAVDDLRLVARQINNADGAIASARSLSAEAQTITNDGGTLEAAGNVTLQAQTLDNKRSARLASLAGSMQLTIGGALDNQRGHITAMQRLEIGSASLNNTGGILQTTGAGSPLVITSGAGVDNSAGGLIRSGGDLQLHAGTEPVNNTAGTMLAQQDLHIQSRGPVDNSQGHLESGQQLVLQDTRVAQGAPLAQATQTLSNQEGRLFSSNGLQVKNQGLTGAGRLDALGDLTLDFAGDITHQGSTAAHGRLQLTTAGKLTNQGQLLGGTETQLTAAQIDNPHGAQISAWQNTTVKATQTLTNRGLIDGQDTRIDAATLDNIGTGRIYGDHVSIAAETLENHPENGGSTAPTIASRQDMDLGVPLVINQGGATLQSLGNMRFGQSLDAKGIATGNGRELRNIGARIDVQGNLDLDTREVNNLNAGLRVEPLAELESKAGEDLISLPGKAPESAGLYKEIEPLVFVPYFSHRNKPYPINGIPGGESDGRIFKPVHIKKFPRVLPAAFIEHRTSHNKGDDFPDDVRLQLEPPGSPRFAEFEIPVPANYTDTAPDPMQFGGFKDDSGQIVWASLAEKNAYDEAVKAYQESIATAQKLHAKILKVLEKDNQLIDSSRDYTRISQVNLTIHRDKIAQTNPAKIEVGGDIISSGNINNVDSTITAGGTIDRTKDRTKPVNNQARPGNQRILTEGMATRYQWQFSGGVSRSQHKRSKGTAPYTHTATVPYSLATVVFKEHHPKAPVTPVDPHSNIGSSAQRPTPVIREQEAASGLRVRTLDSAAVLPQTSLYVLSPARPDRPLVETDPAFTRGQQPTSSAQLLTALDPALLQKRLGDGFYEQQLVQQQVGQLTGRRFLGDHRSNDAQYQALLQSGATFAKAHGLRPGIALSAAQMAELTSDLVWLVEEKVTLPDASQQTVLVPKVYVVARPGDLDVQGGLISADQLLIDTPEDVHNSATLAGRRLVSIKAHDINNVAGNIAGQVVGLEAKRDINVEGGTVSATVALLAKARRDINAASTTGSAPGGNTVVGQRAAFVLIHDQSAAPVVPADGRPPPPSGLHLFAGRDANLHGALIANAVEGSETSISAKRDVNLSPITTSHNEGVVWDRKNRLLLGGTQEVGAEIHTRGLTQILADQDIDARAARVNTTGHLEVDARRSVRITSGQATRSLDDAYHSRRSGFLSSSSKTSAHQTQASQALPSDFHGNTIDIKAGQDIDVIGSKVLSTAGTKLHAARDVNILADAESASEQSQQRSRRSGVFGGNGLGVTMGSQRQSTEQSRYQTGNAPSLIGSLTGSVAIKADNAYSQTGSDLYAKGNIDVHAKRITTSGAAQSERGSMRSSFRQSGLGLSLSSPVIGIAETASSLADAADKASSGRMQALAAGAGALHVYNQRKALQALSTGELRDQEPRLGFTFGKNQSHSQSDYSSSSMRQSRIVAGGKVTLKATGDGEQSNLVLQDTRVRSGKVASLFADNQVWMTTTPETRSASSRQGSRSAGLGMSIGAGGPAIHASGSRGKGRSESEDQIRHQTSVTSGERVDVYSGGHTVLRDAYIRAPRVTTDIGGKLILESLQDTSRFDGEQSSLSGSVGLGAGTVLGSGGYSTSRARGDYASVNRTTGIYAGDSGFDIVVKDITDLRGGQITSTQKAIDNNRNRLATRAITHSDIENRSDYSASGLNISGGVSFGGEKPAKSPGSDTVTDPAGWSQQNQGRPGVNSAGAGYSSAQGSERSITKSGVSPGQFIVTDDAAQRALTGQSAAEAVASMN